MAHANDSIITGKLSGSLGKQIVFRDWDGKTIVAKAPRARKGQPTEAQAAVIDKFQVATRYAKAIITNTDKSLAEAYAAALRPRQNVYSRALEDFLSAPVVKSIDKESYKGAVGDKLAIRAIDDFRVTEVRVEIYATGGALLEAGNAVQTVNGIDWSYTATLVNSTLAGSKIKAIATDVPGNKGTLEVTM